MESLTGRRIAAGLAALMGMSLGLVSLGAPAHAEGSPPVANPDHRKTYSGHGNEFDVLANDTDADGDELKICRLIEPKRHHQMSVSVEDQKVVAFASEKAVGTYTVIYYACDYSSMTRGTLTVTVEADAPRPRVQVRKIPHRPGKLRVINKGKHQASFMWGAKTTRSAKYEDDGRRLVARRSSIIISVRRTAIVWSALYWARPHFEGRSGEVRGIKHRPRTELLPPSLPLSELGWDERARPPR